MNAFGVLITENSGCTDTDTGVEYSTYEPIPNLIKHPVLLRMSTQMHLLVFY